MRRQGVARVWWRKARLGLLGLALLGVALACTPLPGEKLPQPVPTPLNRSIASSSTARATAAEAEAFVAQVNVELKQLYVDAERAAWVKLTYITHDTELLEAKAQERVMQYLARRIKEAQRFEGLELPPGVARSLQLLRLSAGLPAPAEAKLRSELANLSSRLSSAYAKGKVCSPQLIGHGLPKPKGPAWKRPKGAPADTGCRDLGQLSRILATNRDEATLRAAWLGWRTISRPLRPQYQRFVELGNQGARELGFKDMGDIWRGRYDQPPEDFQKEMARTWSQLRPLYEQLHCYVRQRLQKKYGAKIVQSQAPLPAHLLGNMWAQEWSEIYELVEPFPGQSQPDLSQALQSQGYDAEKMVRLAEGFFVSLGLAKLPDTFWQRSLFLKPQDRAVECHASAWDITWSGDLRIKMCIEVNHADLITIHHELGHNYYFHYYNHLPALYQAGAHDGFHEGVGDTLSLAVTPEYLQQVGLLSKAKGPGQAQHRDQADVNLLMQRALDGIAFLPFGYLIDRWRWDVFSGAVPAQEYNAHWWKLRREIQGIQPPAPRSEQDFDPGAKYHIPAHVPYVRYFLARVLQYQFFRALCRVVGHQGPLHRCSFYGNKAAGARLVAMLKLGASKPWPDALEALTGERTLDASALLDYYAPLSNWLKQQNQGQRCGW